MNTIYNPNPNEWTTILKRPTSTFEDVEETVKGIFKEVQQPYLNILLCLMVLL